MLRLKYRFLSRDKIYQEVVIVQTSLGNENVSLGTLHYLLPNETPGACQKANFVTEVRDFLREHPDAELVTGDERLGLYFITPPAAGLSEDLTLGDPIVPYRRVSNTRRRKR